jgi:hypothetical protein
VPDIRPVVALRNNPAGRVPALIIQLIVPEPPVCDMACENVLPTVIAGIVPGLKVMVGQVTDVLLKVWLPEHGPVPVAVITML